MATKKAPVAPATKKPAPFTKAQAKMEKTEKKSGKC